jgi:2-iminobutanoate/2-iminopropanoate deaminase
MAEAATQAVPDLRRNPTAAATAAQSWLVLRNIERTIEALGGRRDQTLKITVFLRDMRDFPAFEAMSSRWFAGNAPALTVLQPSGLPMREARVMIDAVALAN